MPKRPKKIKVCTGPGCRAWDAEEIPAHLDPMKQIIQDQGYKVSYVPCMNKCGGGACVQVNPGRQLIKFKKPKEVKSLFATKKVAVALA